MTDDYARKLFESDKARSAQSPSYLILRNRELERSNAKLMLERGIMVKHLAGIRRDVDPLHDEIDKLKVRVLKYSKSLLLFKQRAHRAEAQVRHAKMRKGKA